MIGQDIFRGVRLAPDEVVLWQGRPTFTGIARRTFHMRVVAAYFAGLLAWDAYQAWLQHETVGRALHDSVPLFLILALGAVIFNTLAWLVARTSSYSITSRRVIFKYGVAITATLSIPHRQIVEAAIDVHDDHSGDIALVLRDGNRMPYLKLWPHARPWFYAHPQPMLRSIPNAATVAGMLSRTLRQAAQEREAAAAAAAAEKVEVGAERLSA